MASDSPDDETHRIIAAALARGQHMPPQQVVELDLCGHADSLRVALEAARIALDALLTDASWRTDQIALADLQIRWSAHQLIIRDVFNRVEECGLATCAAVCTVFALE